jgi:ATP-binding cassette subfamily C (CFTR/MRP) protein 1
MGQWLGTVLDFLSASLAVTGALNQLIQTWTMAEGSLGSIARTRTFEQTTPNENEAETADPGHDWPTGELEVSKITVVYKNETAALKEIEFAVEKGRKLGICGRTGR